MIESSDQSSVRSALKNAGHSLPPLTSRTGSPSTVELPWFHSDTLGDVQEHEKFASGQPTILWAEDLADLSSYQVMIGEDRLSLADFLLRCVSSLDQQSQSPSPTPDFLPLRDAFLRAGLAELSLASSPSRWIQVGLQVGVKSSYQELYRQVVCTARELLDESTISNFFFMHKPPGLRLRFEANGSWQTLLAEELHKRLASWRGAGVIESIVPAVYEPESHLFGGAKSMQSVHRLFTIDSLAWLDYHVLAGSEREESGPAWALSLVMLRGLFTGLGITGWEHIDVWDRIRTKAGRSLPDKQLAHTEFEVVAEGIRCGWVRQDMLLEQLSPAAQEIAESYRLSIESETARWCRDYFWTQEASIGPREAAAFFTIFHWNRAGLPFIRQALLTEALASREAI